MLGTPASELAAALREKGINARPGSGSVAPSTKSVGPQVLVWGHGSGAGGAIRELAAQEL